ncbi:hypothetical protein V565_162490 [Rhizoctonia solani 123E]|uniref:Uncharacterized protein n=1 Tax=Rhizoctonia solani 123E TaxID=1423351 RepID=A0A074RRI6_9AGAM|nr:hypothetical protein V565_162490 [Rhizoctonia solani 123E]
MQADNRLLTNLIKCEKEHHSALLGLLVRSHTSLAALSAYASTASPPVAQALRGCIQSFAAADEGLRGYAAALEGWKEELKEVKRVEDELKAVVKDKDILVGRLIKASKQKIPTSSIQAGPAPIPTSSPSSSSLSFPMPTSQPYQYTPTPHATQHINSKLAQAQRELQACEGHLAGKEAELAEVRRSAIAEGMARRCRAMADMGHVWRERGESGLGALHELSQEAPPNHRRSYSTHSSSSSLAPSHSISQQRHTRSQSPFSPTYPHGSRSASPAPGTYHSINGGYQHSHPLPPLPERNSWHVQDSNRHDPPRRPISLADPPRAPALHRRPISSHDLPALPDQVTFDIPPPHSIGHDTNEFIPLGRPVSGDRWEDSSSEGGEYQVVENHAAPSRWEEPVDPEILRAVEQMGVVSRPVSKPHVNTPPTPPDTVSSSSPARMTDVIESPPPRVKGKGKKTKRAKRDQGDETVVVDKAQSSESSLEAGTRAGPGPVPRVLSSPVPRALSPPAPRALSPPAPRAISPEPQRASPIRLDPSPEPMHVEPHSPVSLDHGAGDPRGDDVTMLASDLVPSTTTRDAVHSSPVQDAVHSSPTHELGIEAHSAFSASSDALGSLSGAVPVFDITSPSTVYDTPKASSTVFNTPRAPSTGFNTPKAPSTVFNTPNLPSTLLDTPRAPSTVFETPRAPPSTFDTPKASSTPLVHSPSPTQLVHPPSPTQLVYSPSPTVYETPLVIPVDIPRMPMYEPRVLEVDVPGLKEGPGSPRETPRSPREGPRSPHETPRSPREGPRSPREDPKSSLPEPPTGLITPMATGFNPKPPAPEPRSKAQRPANGDEPPKRKKTTKKGHSRQSSAVESTRHQPTVESTRRQPSTSESTRRQPTTDGTAPHVRFPAPSNGMYVPSAPAPRPQPGALYLPSNGTTRSDVGPAKGHHFEALPPSGRNRSGSVNGSTSFFGRVAGLFGRKKQSDGYINSGAGQAWRTRTDGNISRTRDDSSEDEQPKNLVAVTNVTPRLVSVDNNPPASPKLGRKLTKTDKAQSLRVGPPESLDRTRKQSTTEEHIVPAKNKKSKSRSVDGGGGVSRKGSVRSTASEPHRANSDAGRKVGKEPASLMAIVEGPGLVLPSALVSRQTESSTLAVPPARAVSPGSTAAPRPVRATSPMPLKSALRNRTPSPLPPTQPATTVPTQSPRNSIAESIYETGEEDFDSATEGEDDRSDVTASGQTATIAPAPAQPMHSPGTALAAFKDNLQTSAGAGSVSTAGPRSANSTRKSVRINPAPPQMSATPTATPGSELDEEPAWTPKPSTSAGWASRIGRGWEDSSDESIDEDYERIRNALATSSKHMESMSKPISRR